MDGVDLACSSESVGAAFAQAQILDFAAAKSKYMNTNSIRGQGWLAYVPDVFFHCCDDFLDRSLAAKTVACSRYQ